MTPEQRKEYAELLPAIANIAAAEGVVTEPRLVPVDTDMMEPTLRRGDFVAVVPAERFMWEGLYLLDLGGMPTVFRCGPSFASGGIQAWQDRRKDLVQTLTKAEFADLLLGKVAFVCNRVS